ncbi:AlbA family DNA-binding domain-containing protein [Fodinibius salsisoli]|uniref:ATP-binding protein n=1 Tax=Fodinibius salsisoli TaxID=2820877 RepID=A0ABT3PJC1_9BACT|nr:ATP-binding protein [Fodinibius salsisoli]
MEDFFDKENYNQDDINNLIKNEVEESLILEFKRAGSLSKKRKDKKEIGKDVSAVANSDGGIIIYGIAEKIMSLLQNHSLMGINLPKNG